MTCSALLLFKIKTLMLFNFSRINLEEMRLHIKKNIIIRTIGVKAKIQNNMRKQVILN